MATVYLARDLKHDGWPVALKVLRPEIAALLGRDQFLREIDLVARLNHPHILPLHDSNEARPSGSGQGFLYYVMPYVEGGSLRDRLAAAPARPVDEAIELALSDRTRPPGGRRPVLRPSPVPPTVGNGESPLAGSKP